MIGEIENELGEIRSFARNERLPVVRVRPVAEGDKSPFFRLTRSSGDWKTVSQFGEDDGQTLSILDLIATQSLVVSFYCPCWGHYARPYLERLIPLSERLRKADVTLLVFSNEPVASLQRQFPNLDFLVAYDAAFSTARQFGVYSEQDPIWDRVSGISEEVFIPALYVVGPDRRIAYRFLDEDFDKTVDIEAVTEAAGLLPA